MKVISQIFILVLFITVQGESALNKYVNKSLFNAVHNFQVNKVISALEKGASVNARDPSNKTALWYAIRYSYVDIVELLVNAESDLDLKFEMYEKSYLHHSIEQANDNQYAITRILIDKGANFNIQDRDGRTPLHYAVKKRDLKFLTLLLEAGADIELQDNNGATPLAYLADQVWEPESKRGKPPTKDTFDLLLEYGADINTLGKDYSSPLIISTLNKQKQMILYLKSKGGKVVNGLYEYPSIFEAIIVGDTLALKKWLNKGVPADYEDKYYKTPLWAAIEYESPEVFLLLIKNGANANWKNEKGMTYLHASGYQNNPYFVKDLVERGLNVNAKEKIFGWTPLMIASMNGKSKIVSALIAEGAKISMTGKSFYDSALMFAASKGFSEVVDLLSANLKSTKKHGGVALYYSALRGDYLITEMLLSRGANPNKSKGLPSALETAIKKQHWEVVKLLKEYGAKE